MGLALGLGPRPPPLPVLYLGGHKFPPEEEELSTVLHRACMVYIYRVADIGEAG
jgi:hypothetical protein